MGCIPEKQSYLSAYEDTITVIQTEHPDWTPSRQRTETAAFLRPKFLMDMAAAAREAKGDLQYDVTEAEFTITDTGDIYYTKYGRTLEELNERTQRLYPEAYSQTDHMTSRLVQDAFQQGATSVITGYFREGNDHRDMVVMRFDPQTRIGTTSIINIASDAKQQSFESLKEHAVQSFPFLHATSPENHVFLLSDVRLKEDGACGAIRPVLPMEAIWQRHMEEQVLSGTGETLRYAGKRVQEEAHETIQKLVTYQKKEKGQHTPSLGQIRHRPNLPGFLAMWLPLKENHGHAPGIPTFVQESRKPDIHRTEGTQKINIGIHTSHPDSATVFLPVIRRNQLRKSERYSKKESGNIVRQDKRGQKEIRTQQQIPTTTVEHAIHIRGKKTERRVGHMLHTGRNEHIGLSKERRYKKRKDNHILAATAPIYELMHLWRRTKKKLKEVVSGTERTDIRKRKSSKDRLVQQTVLRVTEAIIIWMLVESVGGIQKQRPQHPAEQKMKTVGKQTEHADQISGPWILFSIVWYLVMLREQCAYRTPPKKKKTGKNRTTSPQVIYTYAFPYDHQSHSFFVI